MKIVAANIIFLGSGSGGGYGNNIEISLSMEYKDEHEVVVR